VHTLVLVGHPNSNSFNAALAESYAQGIRATGRDAEVLYLSNLEFDPILHLGHSKEQPLEPDLVSARDKIAAADHLFVVTPVWWGSSPALLKGFIDRVFLPGWAFAYEEGAMLQTKLLAGRSARVVLTMDAPSWYYRWFYGQPLHGSLIHATLGFTGFSVGSTTISQVRTLTADQREAWLGQMHRLAQRDVVPSLWNRLFGGGQRARKRLASVP